jgi:DNA-directed RNA polymerase subunit RPC12/RpoP
MWIVVLLLIIAIGLALLVLWHARTFGYRCRSCGNEFEISLLVDFISPHGLGFGGGWKLLRCPKCGRWTRAFVIRKSDMRRE